MKRLHIFLLLILALVLIGWFLVWPAFQEVFQGREALALWQQKSVQAQESKQKLTDLEAKYETMQEEENRVLNAVPPSEDIPGLLIQMEALASQNGLILTSLNFVYPESEKGARAVLMETGDSGQAPASSAVTLPSASLPAGVDILTLNLKLSGNYNSLKNFLKAIENNLRLTDVSTINFSKEKTGSDLGELNIGLNVYYKK